MKGRGIHNAALAAVDYRTGQVYAYTGSAGFYLKGNKKFQPQFDVLEDGWRQPGSAFKPISYIIGIDDRTLTAATLFMDVVTDFGGGWTPADADRLERGPLRLRQALQVSLNIPAIKAAVRIGPDHVFEKAKDFGIRFQTASNPGGASIAIGTVEVHMIDLISAYGAIAQRRRPHAADRRSSRSTTPTGEKIWPLEGADAEGQAGRQRPGRLHHDRHPRLQHRSRPEPVLEPAQRSWTARAGAPAALKTGTTDCDDQDLTAVGYLAPPKDPDAPALVVGAWMGNSDNSAPPQGGRRPRVGRVALAVVPDRRRARARRSRRFRKPTGVVQATVDAHSGMRPGPFTTQDGQGVVHRGHRPQEGRRHEVRRRDRQGDRRPLAGGLRGPEGRQRLPRPVRRRGRAPGPGPSPTAAGSAAPPSGPGVRRARADARRRTSTRPAAGRRSARLGRAVRADEDLRDPGGDPDPAAVRGALPPTRDRCRPRMPTAEAGRRRLTAAEADRRAGRARPAATRVPLEADDRRPVAALAALARADRPHERVGRRRRRARRRAARPSRGRG